MTADEADRLQVRSVTKALGYIELAQMAQAAGQDTKAMTDAAIKALQEFSNNDDAIDAMWEADWEEYYRDREERYGP